jgi:hypothetical protein
MKILVMSAIVFAICVVSDPSSGATGAGNQAAPPQAQIPVVVGPQPGPGPLPTPGGAPAPGTPGQPGRPGPSGPGMPLRDPSKVAPATGKSVIRGRVVALDTGTPLRRVQIRLAGAEVRTPRGTMTDAQGNYELKELPAGRYQLQASKGGFVTLSYGQRRPLDPGRPLELADAQTIEKIDFHLPRGGVITGRVVDELGEPVTDTTVSAMVFRRIGGQRRLQPVNRPFSTNDVGVYRLYGLPPGEYYVAAGAFGGFGADSMMDNSSGSGYAPTYYPGTPSVSDAQRVTVSIGEEVTADVQLVPTRVSKISGLIVDESGRPTPMAFVSLQSRDPSLAFGGMGMGAGSVRGDGTFTLSNVAPGSYYVMAMVMGPSGGFNTRSGGYVPITVSGQDIEGIRIVATKGATIKGRIVYEGGEAPAAGSMAPRVACQMSPTPDAPMMMSGSPAGIDEQAQFELVNVHRPCLVRVFPTPPNWTLKAVMHDGQDVTDRPLVVKDTDTMTDVTVVLTNRVTTVTGSVTDAKNQPTKDYVVLVFPEDAEKIGPQSRYVRTGRADQEGQFKLIGLPPGEYLAVALDSIEEGAESDPEFVNQIRASGVRVRLSEGVPESLRLKLITPGSVNP